LFQKREKKKERGRKKERREEEREGGKEEEGLRVHYKAQLGDSHLQMWVSGMEEAHVK
jgi:hypothetical protein